MVLPGSIVSYGSVVRGEIMAASDAFDRAFLEKMVEHHFVAVKMAEACGRGGVRAELRDMAARMRTDQSAEIERMQAWLREWYDVDTKPEVPAQDRAMLDDLESLSDAELEMEFLTMMVKHHGSAIEDATAAIAKAEQEELKSFCRDLVEKQRGESDQMQAWLKAWHGSGQH